MESTTLNNVLKFSSNTDRYFIDSNFNVIEKSFINKIFVFISSFFSNDYNLEKVSEALFQYVTTLESDLSSDGLNDLKNALVNIETTSEKIAKNMNTSKIIRIITYIERNREIVQDKKEKANIKRIKEDLATIAKGMRGAIAEAEKKVESLPNQPSFDEQYQALKQFQADFVDVPHD